MDVGTGFTPCSGSPPLGRDGEVRGWRWIPCHDPGPQRVTLEISPHAAGWLATWAGELSEFGSPVLPASTSFAVIEVDLPVLNGAVSR